MSQDPKNMLVIRTCIKMCMWEPPSGGLIPCRYHVADIVVQHERLAILDRSAVSATVACPLHGHGCSHTLISFEALEDKVGLRWFGSIGSLGALDPGADVGAVPVVDGGLGAAASGETGAPVGVGLRDLRVPILADRCAPGGRR